MTISERLDEIVNELLTSGITLEQATLAFEKNYVGAALRRERRVNRAAIVLGVHRNTLHGKLRAWREVGR